jgi:hypothetical protein
MSYKQPLPKIDVLRANYPKEMAELDACITIEELSRFRIFAKDQTGSDAYVQIGRYADIRLIQSQVPAPAHLAEDQYLENCVAERVWNASLIFGKVDKKTRLLIEKYGYVRGMVEQLKPLSKVGAGNFPALHKSGLADCTAEYCVWKWGRHVADKKLLDWLDQVATQYSFN